jgi:hypothetical protein
MTATEWIVCERSSRWTAAIRTALARQARPPLGAISLREVRSLADLNARISDRPNNLVLLEVAFANLDEVLAWMAESMRSSRNAHVVALLDTDLAQPCRVGAFGAPHAWQDVVDAVQEAGALEVVQSPRHLHHVLRSFRKLMIAHPPSQSGHSLESWACGLLPWQDPPPPLR